MAKQIYVNLPIKDINRSREFFTKLGYKFNPQFSDEKSLCLIISENIYVMLLGEKFFKDFIPGKEITDSSKSSEVLIAINSESKEDVDKMIEKVIESGGKEYRETTDYGWMYARAFQDLDGHIWEVIYMDDSKMPEEMKKRGE